MSNSKSLHIVKSAMFAALILVATFIIKIPTPGTGGYIHPGDAFVILSGVILGPLYGGAAAAIGSALADILGGYFISSPLLLWREGTLYSNCSYTERARSQAFRQTLFRGCQVL